MTKTGMLKLQKILFSLPHVNAQDILLLQAVNDDMEISNLLEGLQ